MTANCFLLIIILSISVFHSCLCVNNVYHIYSLHVQVAVCTKQQYALLDMVTQCSLRGQIYSHNFPCSLEGTNYDS